MPKKTLLFDLDGTLVDSKPGIETCFRETLHVLGVPLAPSTDLDWLVGPPIIDAFRHLKSQGFEFSEQEALKIFREKYKVSGVFNNVLYEGISNTLQSCLSLGFSCHVATSKPEVFAKMVISQHGLDGLFASVFGSDLDGKLNTKGKVIRHLMSSKTISANDSWMIGDREHDVLGALECDVQPIGVLWGYGSRSELENVGCKILISSPAELPHFLMSH
jgi:phosphoglycolate phosphatase